MIHIKRLIFRILLPMNSCLAAFGPVETGNRATILDPDEFFAPASISSTPRDSMSRDRSCRRALRCRHDVKFAYILGFQTSENVVREIDPSEVPIDNVWLPPWC
jgi:hypothetical protein